MIKIAREGARQRSHAARHSVFLEIPLAWYHLSIISRQSYKIDNDKPKQSFLNSIDSDTPGKLSSRSSALVYDSRRDYVVPSTRRVQSIDLGKHGRDEPLNRVVIIVQLGWGAALAGFIIHASAMQRSFFQQDLWEKYQIIAQTVRIRRP